MVLDHVSAVVPEAVATKFSASAKKANVLVTVAIIKATRVANRLPCGG